MSRFQRPLPLPKSPRSSFVQRSPIILMRRPYRSWRSPCRILKSTGKCSWNFRWSLKMKSAGPAPRKGWRVGRQIALLTRSAIVSDGTRSATDRLCWDLPAPFLMSFANLPKRSCRPLAMTIANYAGIKPPGRNQHLLLSLLAIFRSPKTRCAGQSRLNGAKLLVDPRQRKRSEREGYGRARLFRKQHEPDPHGQPSLGFAMAS